MAFIPTKHQSAPDCQLNKPGTARTKAILFNAIRSLSKSEINELEEELRFYTQTGLIDIQMSRLLDLLQQTDASAAA